MILHLHLKKEFFDAIKAGTKKFEYRAFDKYTYSWEVKRNVLYDQKAFSSIRLYCGYPHSTDSARILNRAYKGMTVDTITHHHFGDKPIKVFVIDVSEPLIWSLIRDVKKLET